jgi:hypothetical protein
MAGSIGGASAALAVTLIMIVSVSDAYYPALYATAGLMVLGAIIALLVGPPEVWREQE